ncbi:MAG: uroporphyrinogen-III synthase, partial [Desulfovermiculus sp.]
VQEQVKLACIGPITARTLEGYGFLAHIQPQEYTIPALAQALVEDAG